MVFILWLTETVGTCGYALEKPEIRFPLGATVSYQVIIVGAGN